MHIDKQSPIPIYYQIMEQLKSQIKNGELQPDAPLPSEREYSEQFGISRMTVRQALSNLVNEGFLYRQKGRGTFVSRPKMEQTLQGLTSFTEDMKSRGMVPSSKLVDYELIDSTAELAGILIANTRPKSTKSFASGSQMIFRWRLKLPIFRLTWPVSYMTRISKHPFMNTSNNTTARQFLMPSRSLNRARQLRKRQNCWRSRRERPFS